MKGRPCVSQPRRFASLSRPTAGSASAFGKFSHLRLALGLRDPGGAAGLRWADTDLEAGYVRVRRPIVLVRGAVTESTPKTKTGDRQIWLAAMTAHYTHIEAEAHKAAAEVVARLVEGASS